MYKKYMEFENLIFRIMYSGFIAGRKKILGSLILPNMGAVRPLPGKQEE